MSYFRGDAPSNFAREDEDGDAPGWRMSAREHQGDDQIRGKDADI